MRGRIAIAIFFRRVVDRSAVLPQQFTRPPPPCLARRSLLHHTASVGQLGHRDRRGCRAMQGTLWCQHGYVPFPSFPFLSFPFLSLPFPLTRNAKLKSFPLHGMQCCKVSLNTEFKVENTRGSRVAELKTRVAKLKTRVAELKTRVNFAWILTKSAEISDGSQQSLTQYRN